MLVPPVVSLGPRPRAEFTAYVVLDEDPNRGRPNPMREMKCSAAEAGTAASACEHLVLAIVT